MSRLITLRATFDELFGDETYELWLKHGTNPWTVFDTGVVALTSGHQDFALDELVEGDTYKAQIRLVRDGRVRLAYQSSDPSVWPASSLITFVVGALTSVGSPTLSAAEDVLVSDNFNRANGALGNAVTGQTWALLSGTVAIVSNRFVPTVLNIADSSAAAILNMGVHDHVESEMTASVVGPGTLGMTICASDDWNDGVDLVYTPGGPLQLTSYVGGSAEFAAVTHAVVLANGDKLRLRKVGKHVTAYLNDVEIMSLDTLVDQNNTFLVVYGQTTLGAQIDDVSVKFVEMGWERLDATHAPIVFNITADDASKDIDIYRDGVLIDTLVGGSYETPALYSDAAALGVAHSYIAKHRAGTLSGTGSNELTVFAGPPGPPTFAQSSSTSAFGTYTVDWDDLGSSARLQDDFLCPLAYRDVIVTGTGTRTEVLESDVMPVNPTQTASFRARVRREVTSFGVTDVSDWVTITVRCLIYEANTDYQSCP